MASISEVASAAVVVATPFTHLYILYSTVITFLESIKYFYDHCDEDSKVGFQCGVKTDYKNNGPSCFLPASFVVVVVRIDVCQIKAF
jgi:hypothetical protein